ncbi:MAG: hypothetical protein IPP83_07920 [Flavobacteriales bacterium]|nr:hypothetical protein [Flavobacteriales bacterium]
MGTADPPLSQVTGAKPPLGSMAIPLEHLEVKLTEARLLYPTVERMMRQRGLLLQLVL